MFQQRSDRSAAACNDNGALFRCREQRVEAANEDARSICLSYVAQGCFRISSQEPTSVPAHRRAARAA
jgi:hypothetical protein